MLQSQHSHNAALHIYSNIQVLTGSWRHDAPLQLWDYGSGRLMSNLPFHQPGPESCKVYSAKFGRGAYEGQVLAGGSGSRPVARLYNKVSSGAVVVRGRSTDKCFLGACDRLRQQGKPTRRLLVGRETAKVYSAKLGRGAFEGQVLAGGNGGRPVARLYNKVSSEYVGELG